MASRPVSGLTRTRGGLAFRVNCRGAGHGFVRRRLPICRGFIRLRLRLIIRGVSVITGVLGGGVGSFRGIVVSVVARLRVASGALRRDARAGRGCPVQTHFSSSCTSWGGASAWCATVLGRCIWATR